MVTGETAQTSQLPGFVTVRTLTPRKQQSQQHQNVSAQVANDNKLPMVEYTLNNQKSDSNNSINRLAEATAGFATQQWPQTVSTNTLICLGKNEDFEFFENLYQTLLKLQPKITEAMRNNHFHAHLWKGALKNFRNISWSNGQFPDDVLIVFWQKYVKLDSQAPAKRKWHKLTIEPKTKSLPDFLQELRKCAERAFADNA